MKQNKDLSHFLEHPEELYWLAGLLEGDGCFLTEARKTGVAPRIQFKCIDRDTTVKVARLFGGKAVTVRKPYLPNYKPQFSTQVSGAWAGALMELLQPIMGKRRSRRIGEILNEA